MKAERVLTQLLSQKSGPAQGSLFWNLDSDFASGSVLQPDKIGVLTGFNSGVGYDLATGLGSVNAENLVNNWPTQ